MWIEKETEKMFNENETQSSSLAEQVASALGISGTPNETNSETQASETTEKEPEVKETATTSETNQQSAQETETEKTNPMHDLRQRYSSTKKEADGYRDLLQRIADAKGLSIDQLKDQIQMDEDRKKAEKLGVTPEVQRTLREQQDKIDALERRYREENFNNRLADFRRNYSLTDKQLKDFALQARNAGIDILNPGVDMTVVYRSLNYDKLMNTERESIRQQILQDMAAQKQQSPSVNTVKTETNKTGSEYDGMSELDIIKKALSSFSR